MELCIEQIPHSHFYHAGNLAEILPDNLFGSNQIENYVNYILFLFYRNLSMIMKDKDQSFNQTTYQIGS